MFTNLLWRCPCSRKFFTEPKANSSWSQNSNFLRHFEPFWVQRRFERVWNSKNHQPLTFLLIKTVSRVVRSCCLFLQVPMVVKNCLQTQYIIVIAQTIFCSAQTHQRSIQKHYFLHNFARLKKKLCKIMQKVVFVHWSLMSLCAAKIC